MEKLRIGLAVTASCCCYGKALDAFKTMAQRHELTAIVSENAAAIDSRFGTAKWLIEELESLTGRPVLRSIADAEPIGPQKLFDVLVIAPCTANTAAKIALGITDGAVTMAAKSHLRGGRPVVLAFGSNDGLGASAHNIGTLLARRDIYFVPFYQDDALNKPRSLASDYAKLEETVLSASRRQQIQPIIVEMHK